MANKTVKEAVAIRGTDPQKLIDHIVRTRIYESIYWKEECFALTAELVVDKAMALKYIGGMYAGNAKPTPFLCLVLKLLQIQPEKEIIQEFIHNEEFKYVRVLGAFYWRLVGNSKEVYTELEPLYKDYRKILLQDKMGKFHPLHVDELIDHLLRDERYCDVILPLMQKRLVLEETNEMGPRASALDDELHGLRRDHDYDEKDDATERPPVKPKPNSQKPTMVGPMPRRPRSSSSSSSSTSSSDSDAGQKRRGVGGGSSRRRSRSRSPRRRESPARGRMNDRNRSDYEHRRSRSGSRDRFRRDDRTIEKRKRSPERRNKY